MNTDQPTGRWIAHEKHFQARAKDARCFEVSVVREDNEHGRRSYGWLGPHKILIASGECAPRAWSALKPVLLKHATDTAERFNKEEAARK